MTTKCHFGNHEATNIKVEVERTWDDEKDREVVTKVRLPICRPCHLENYDGTEEFPKLLAL